MAIALSWLGPVSISIADGPAPEDDWGRYERCMATARADPKAALKTARTWIAARGGAPARHCEAVALIGAGNHAEAARRLERIADDPSDGRIGRLRADLMSQAGNAWLLAGNATLAVRAFDSALRLRPGDVDMLIDRSLARATQRRYLDAIDDLTVALRRAPDRTAAFVLRATALRRLGRLEPARQDIGRALALDPSAPEALLEQGIVRRLSGDPTGAREAWARLLAVAPGSASAKIARKHLARLDASGR